MSMHFESVGSNNGGIINTQRVFHFIEILISGNNQNSNEMLINDQKTMCILVVSIKALLYDTVWVCATAWPGLKQSMCNTEASLYIHILYSFRWLHNKKKQNTMQTRARGANILQKQFEWHFIDGVLLWKIFGIWLRVNENENEMRYWLSCWTRFLFKKKVSDVKKKTFFEQRQTNPGRYKVYTHTPEFLLFSDIFF